MKKILVQIIFVITVTNVFAQEENNIEKEILNYNDGKSVIIQKGRKMLVDKFIAGDTSRVRKIKNYLLEQQDKNYLALFDEECFFILYWTNEYDELISRLWKFYIPDKLNFTENKILPCYDQLALKLRKESIENNLHLINQIKLSKLTEEQKSFLILNFEFLTKKQDYGHHLDYHTPQYERDSLNAHADEFLKTYPISEFSDIVKKHFRYVYIPKKFGWGIEFGTAYGIYTGLMSKTYTNSAAFDFSFDFSYKKLTLHLFDYIGGGKTKKDIPYSSGILKKGVRSGLILPNAVLSYPIIDKNKFKIAPFAGVGGGDFNVPSDSLKNNPDLREISNSATAYIVGFMIDYNFLRSTNMYALQQNNFFVRIKYSYNFLNFKPNQYNPMSGNAHGIAIYFGGFGRRLKRQL